MSWSDVGKYLEGGAGVLANVLTGNIPGAVATVGNMIAGKLGTANDPDAVLQELKSNPDALLKLKQLEADHETDLEKLQVQKAIGEAKEATARIQAVNTTMQQEAKAEHWPQWSWRPFNGFVFGTTLFCNYALPAIVNTVAPIFAQHWSAVVSAPIPDAVFYAWGAILGVTAWHRGRMKRTLAGDTGLADKVAGAVQKAKGK